MSSEEADVQGTVQGKTSLVGQEEINDGDAYDDYYRDTTTFLEEEIMGYKLWNLLVGVTILFVAALLINWCWTHCAKDSKDRDPDCDEECHKIVLAHQIGPGVMMVHGVKGQQIFTAIDDNEDLRMHMLSQQYTAAGYGSMTSGVRGQPSTATAPVPEHAPLRTHVQRPSTAPCAMDINYEGTGNPPPYFARGT